MSSQLWQHIGARPRPAHDNALVGTIRAELARDTSDIRDWYEVYDACREAIEGLSNPDLAEAMRLQAHSVLDIHECQHCKNSTPPQRRHCGFCDGRLHAPSGTSIWAPAQEQLGLLPDAKKELQARRARLNAATGHMHTSLTGCQRRALCELESASHKRLVLTGPAGTGKTALVAEWIRRMWPSRQRRVVLLAPTHKAVKVLREALVAHPDIRIESEQFSSLHAAVGAIRRVCPRTGEDAWTLGRRTNRFRNADLVIVDECSMLSAEHLRWIEQCCSSHRVLFMGDMLQLPPVQSDSTLSPVFEQYEHISLEQVVRQGKALGDVVTAYRQAMDSPELMLPSSSEPDVTIWRSGKEMTRAYLEAARESESVKLLAFRNDTVNRFNRWARRKLIPDAIGREYVEGERLVVDVAAPGSTLWVGHEFTPELIELAAHPFLDVSVTRLHTQDGQHIDVLNEEQQLAFRAELRRRKPDYEGRLDEFDRLRRSISKVSPAWACTVHKAQGSTWSHVFIQEQDILLDTDEVRRKRLLYVAYSRAAKSLHLFRPAA